MTVDRSARRGRRRSSVAAVLRPRQWAIWSLGSATAAWMVIIDAVAVVTGIVSIAAEEAAPWESWVMLGALAACATAHLVFTRPAEERRRAAHLVGQVEHVDQTSIWIFSAALVLPAQLLIALIAVVRWQRYLIARKPPGRYFFTSCSIALAAMAVHWIGRVGPLSGSLDAVRTVPAALALAALLTTAVAAYYAIQAVIVGFARAVLTGSRSPVELLGTRDDNVLIVYTLLLGVFATVAAAFAPAALVAVVIVATRNTRSEQRMAQLRAEREQLQVDALHDALTGLPNRRGFEPQAELALVADSAQQSPTAVLMADLDHFKDWNTRLGHFGADQLLTAVARALRRNVRATDLLCRWGGEEIALLFPATNRTEAAVLAERLRAAISDISLQVSRPAGGADTMVTGCTVSLGVAVAPEDGTTLAQLQERADQALQQAKDAGRNQVRFASGTSLVPQQRNRPPQQPAFRSPRP